MRRHLIAGLMMAAALPLVASAQEEAANVADYSIVKTTRLGGNGAWGQLFADSEGRRLYVPRAGTGQAARIAVYDLDTLKAAGTIAGVNANAVTVDSKSGHGFAASKPLVMFDTKTNKTIKTIDVQGTPDTIFFDAFNSRVYVFSDTAPNATVIDSVTGNVLGTIDLGGAPEQAASDGKGRVFVAIEDKDEVAVIDANTMQVAARWDLDGVGASPVTVSYDAKNNVLFVGCRNETMIYMNAQTGRFVYGLPIGKGIDSAAFNPATSEIFSAQDDGTFTIARVTSPTAFVMEGTVVTPEGARSMVLDQKTGNLLIATAEYSAKPKPVSFYALPDRSALRPGSFSILTLEREK